MSAGAERVPQSPDCRICQGETSAAGVVHGRYSGRDYRLARCRACGYAFVTDPWLDFAQIYDDRYYSGKGADPLVDYGFELDHPELTVRIYEWEGIASVVGHLLFPGDRAASAAGGRRSLRWLDYGCGNGGLVRHLRSSGAAEAFGFEEGAIASRVRDHGIPMLSVEELSAQAGSFDVVTAIEVLEHTTDPVAELRRMRSLLRDGGLLFLTTGNARSHAEKLDRWSYVVPEIHISFFEPRTLERAFKLAGFRAERRTLGTGFAQVLKFKVLKNLRVRRRSVLTDALPARLVGAVADRRERLSEQPVGWAA
jgi:SAM-dependent methyltransferase